MHSAISSAGNSTELPELSQHSQLSQHPQLQQPELPQHLRQQLHKSAKLLGRNWYRYRNVCVHDCNSCSMIRVLNPCYDNVRKVSSKRNKRWSKSDSNHTFCSFLFPPSVWGSDFSQHEQSLQRQQKQPNKHDSMCGTFLQHNQFLQHIYSQRKKGFLQQSS